MSVPMYPEIDRLLDELGLSPRYKSGIQHTVLMVRPLLHYLPRGIPGYTDHGVLHSQNLMRLLYDFVGNWTDTPFSEEEKYLLCLAVWLHDIGCLLGRYKHNKKSEKLLTHPRFFFIQDLLDGALRTCLKYIIVSHTSDYDLKKIPDQPIHASVRLDLVCAVFRLLDGCDITDSRAKPILYDILKDNSKLKASNIPHWESHLSTLGAVFRGEKIHITHRKGRKRKAKLLVSTLEDDLERLNEIFRNYGVQFAIELHSSEY